MAKWKVFLEFRHGDREPQAVEVRDENGRMLYCISILAHSVMIDPAGNGEASIEPVRDRPDAVTVRVGT